MNHRLLSFLLLFVSFNCLAQIGWERLYPIDMRYEHLTVDGTDYQDGYLRLALSTERNEAFYNHANITKIDSKGANAWSRDIVVGDSLELYKEGDLALLHNDNIAISLAGIKDSLSQFIAVTDPSGNILWSKQYAIYQDSSAFDIVKPRITQSKVDTLSLYHAGIGLDAGTQQIYISKVNAETGITQWANYISKEGSELVFGSMASCIEGGVIVLAIDRGTEQFVITKIDADGNILYSREVTTPLTPGPTNSVANSILQMADSTFVIVGNYFDEGVEYDGYIVKLDAQPEVEWGKRVDFDFSFNNVTMLDVIESVDNNILISAKQVGELDTVAFGVKMDKLGEIIWRTKFKVTDVENIQLGGLGEANDGGMSFFLTGGNAEAEQYIPYLITTDADGMTLCSEELDDIFFDVDFTSTAIDLVSSPYIATFTEFCCEGNSHIGDDRDNVVTSVKQYDGVDYILGNNNQDNGNRFGFLTKLDSDGTPEWTFEMNEPTFFFEFVKTDDDNIIIVGRDEPFNFSTDNNAIMINVDDDGNLIESKKYDISGRDMFTKIIHHPNAIDPTNPLYITARINKNDNPSAIDDVMVININSQMDINWTQRVNLDGQDTEIDNIIPMSNGNIALAGYVEPSQEVFIQMNGLNGSQVLATRSNANNYTREIVQLTDGRFVVASGYLNDLQLYLLDANMNYLNGVSLDNSVSLIRDLEVGAANTVFVSCDVNGTPAVAVFSFLNAGLIVTNSVRYFDGNLSDATVSYIDTEGDNISYADGRVNDNGEVDVFHYSGSVVDMFNCTYELDLQTTPFPLDIIGTDVNITLDTIEETISGDITQLDWTREDYCENITFEECSEIEILSDPFSGFMLPMMSLESRPFCSNEELIWTFDASTPGAISYLWQNEDGDPIGTADTLTVTEEGMYNVIVTVGEDVCFQLCDTAEIAIFEEPGISLNQSEGDFCTTGEINLFASPTAEAGIDSINWSTGEMGTAIMVSDPGTYTVTIVDNCGITAEASIDAEFPTLVSGIDISDGFTTYCETGVYTLTTNLTPEGAPFTSVEWSTGDSGFSINVVDAGVYTVTVLDYCMNEFIETITVADIPTVLADMPIDSIFASCQEDSVFLSVVPTYPAGFSYSWTPDGQTSPFINVPIEDGTYSVQVTDACGNVSPSVSYTVNDGDCIPIRWPNVFIPSSDADHGYNNEFGPVVYNGEGITDYTLEIYNRWGEKVFESDDFDEQWDGIYNEKEQPGDVYLYISSYSLFGREILQKGDITLLR